MNTNVFQAFVRIGLVTGVTAFSAVAYGNAMEVCDAMRQAISPSNGATVISEQTLGARGGVMRTFRLATPMTIGGAKVEGLFELGNTLRIARKLPDEASASKFGQALAEQYGQSQSEQSSARIVYRVNLTRPFVSATTTVSGRNVQFYCSLE